MAEETAKVTEKPAEKDSSAKKVAKKKYYLNKQAAAERIRRKGKVERFTPYYYTNRMGDRLKVGYLEVDANSPVVKTLDSGSRYVEISKKEYDEAVKDSVRAPQ